MPDQFVHIFVDQTEWLVKFLEFVVEQNNATPLVYNTLLELYLRDDEDVPPSLSRVFTYNLHEDTVTSNEMPLKRVRRLPA